MGKLRGAPARESLGLSQLGVAGLELLLELGGSSLCCCNFVLELGETLALSVQLAALGGQALLALANLAFRRGQLRAALLELRLLARDVVLLGQLALVSLDLLGEGGAHLALALLRFRELAAKLLELLIVVGTVYLVRR